MTKASRKVTAKDQATARRLRQSIPYHLKPEIAAFAGMHFEQLQKFAAGRRHQWRLVIGSRPLWLSVTSVRANSRTCSSSSGNGRGRSITFSINQSKVQSVDQRMRLDDCPSCSRGLRVAS